MRKLLRMLGGLVLVSVIIGGIWLANAIWFKPFSIDTFFNRAVVFYALESPEMLSSLRLLEQVGLDFHNDDLDDASPESTLKTITMMEKDWETLKSYDDEDLTEDQLLSKQIALYFIETAAGQKDFAFHNYPVNQLFGVQNQLPSFLDSTHQVNNQSDAANYLTRLTKVATKFDQVIEGLKYREQRNILPPRFVVDRVLTEMKNFIATDVQENILYSSLAEKLSKTKIETDDQTELLSQAETNIAQSVYPSYQKLIDYFTALRPKTDDRDGVWKLPRGDEYYKNTLRFFTTTDDSPEEIHNKGLTEVDRIQKEILAILAGEGFAVDQGFASAIDQMANDESFYYPDTAEGRKEILADYQKIIDEITAGMDKAFPSLPKASVEVKRIPEFKEKTAPGAYYNRPPMDGSKPGTFYANLYDIKATPKYGMRTLAYHEAVPGHHFQIASSMELEGVPFFRKMSPFTAYTEGWALYAERLAWEMGFQNNPFDNIGRLQAELFRAVRLVVDTGIHHKRWNRQSAIDYMKANTGMAESDVTAEIERYIVMPGQACAYKIGMMKILELRTLAEERLGDQYDLKEFHRIVLKDGAVPLEILGQLVEKHIEQVLAAQPIKAAH